MKQLIMQGGISVAPIDPNVCKLLGQVLAINEQVISILKTPPFIESSKDLTAEERKTIREEWERFSNG